MQYPIYLLCDLFEKRLKMGDKSRAVNLVSSMLRDSKNISSSSSSSMPKKPEILQKLDAFLPQIQRANLLIEQDNGNGSDSKRTKTIDSELRTASSDEESEEEEEEEEDSEEDSNEDEDDENEGKKIIEMDIAIVPCDNDVLMALGDDKAASSSSTMPSSSMTAHQTFSCYMDYNATTPLDVSVRKAMRGILKEGNPKAIPPPDQAWGNPSSMHQPFGADARKVHDKSRKQVGDLIGVKHEDVDDEILFTSGGTESINLAIIGSVLSKIKRDKVDGKSKNGNVRYHIVTSSLEHPAVGQSIAYLTDYHDVEVTTVYPRADEPFYVNPEDIIASIRPDGSTVLVTVMLVHNVSGVIQPVSEIGKLLKDFRAKFHKTQADTISNGYDESRYPLFHTDASQGLGKIDADVNELSVDMLTVTPHKFYGPKGVGALYLRRYIRLHHICAIMVGGGQEKSLRSGTENVLLCVGFGEACRVAKDVIAKKEEPTRLFNLLHNVFLKSLESQFKERGVKVHRFFPEDTKYLTPGVIFLGFSLDDEKGTLIDGYTLLKPLGNIGVYVSAGSACIFLSGHDITGKSIGDGSKVSLHAYDKDSEIARSDLEFRGIRFSIGRYTTESALKQAVPRIVNVITESLKIMKESQSHA